ncbi:MAG TPA: hypothetical protein PLL66_06100 [Bacteroidales bacterium]|nr:hypothetical protein [Bacteroidales bacterium]
MNLKTITFLIITTIFAVSVLAQDKHITYTGDIYSVSLKGAAGETPNAIYKLEKGIHNILVFDDKKAVFYSEPQSEPTKDSISSNKYCFYDFNLFDKKKKSSKNIKITYITETDSIKKDKNSDEKWIKMKPDKKPKLTEETIAMQAYLESQGINTEFTPPEIIYTDDIKQIGDYHCKKAMVTEGQRKYTVWFTEEIKYNWCFDDFRYLIPGTVILIEYEEKPYLEFVSIEELNYDKLSIDKKIIDWVLENW